MCHQRTGRPLVSVFDLDWAYEPGDCVGVPRDGGLVEVTITGELHTLTREQAEALHNDLGHVLENELTPPDPGFDEADQTWAERNEK